MKKTQRSTRSHRSISFSGCHLLIFIVLVAFSAVFSTLSQTSGNCPFAWSDAGNRLRLFRRIQAYASLWPDIYPNPAVAFEKIAQTLDSAWNESQKRVNVADFFAEGTSGGVHTESSLSASSFATVPNR